jgi:hypothetical protein
VSVAAFSRFNTIFCGAAERKNVKYFDRTKNYSVEKNDWKKSTHCSINFWRWAKSNKMWKLASLPRPLCKRHEFKTCHNGVCLRVARWYIFKPKIPFRVNFGGPWNAKVWYNLLTFGIYYGHLVYVMIIRKFSGYLVYFSPFWYIVSRNIWQPWLASKMTHFETNPSELVG